MDPGPEPARRRGLIARLGVWPMAFTLAGLAVFVAVIAYYGWNSTLRVLDHVSPGGFATYLAVQMAIIGGLSTAWWLLLWQRGRYPLLYWGRMVRDAAGQFLPFSHVGGFVLGARAVSIHGIAPTDAAASTMADIAVEFLAELGFIGLGLLLLALRAPNSRLVLPVAIGLGAACLGAFGFIAIQRGGGRLFRALALRIANAGGGDASMQVDRLQAALDRIYQRRGRLLGAGLVHLACWFGTGFASFVAFHVLGVGISLLTALAIEAILHAILSAGFFVPGRVGVQEAAYALLGAAFGIPPDIALSVSLLRRARDLVIAVPVLFIWQGLEVRRLRPASGR
ncbi:MAG TPA: lysylphosphatidylglycerol synthase domain-containing protein [Acetobacteraceae bacterium]|nr:lysylphosphatidylglycerol synthase domain-containing protein [Acetobacteraceae bacterium]